jgi:hypothetical protein
MPQAAKTPSVRRLTTPKMKYFIAGGYLVDFIIDPFKDLFVTI